VFLGGWHPIFFEDRLRGALPPFWFAALGAGVFLAKMIVMMWLQLTVRWLLPRFRYDQIQKLCWRMLLPLGIANVFVSAALVLLDPTYKLLALVGAAEIVALVVWIFGAKPSAAPAAGAAHDSHGAHGAQGASADLAHVHGSH
jgi:NADH-quinone oxidoreductase subunit H